MQVKKLLDEVQSYGFELKVDGDKIKGISKGNKASIPNALIEQIKMNKPKLISLLAAKAKPFIPSKPSSKSELVSAMNRLEFGECQAVRFYSHTCGRQFLVLADDEIPESITVDCPTFTLSELEKLVGSSTELIKNVYQLKQVFGAKVDF